MRQTQNQTRMLLRQVLDDKGRFGKWRLILLVFIIIYACLMTFDLGYAPIQWDEANHLNGGSLLFQANTQEYIQSNSFYPPLLDLSIAILFKIVGPSLLSGRLPSIISSLFLIWVVFELTNKFYDPKIALASSIIIGSMPGIVWLSRLALTEIMLLALLSSALFFFYRYLNKDQTKDAVVAGIFLGLGFLTKYQAFVAIIVMVVCLIVLRKHYPNVKARRLAFAVVAALVMVLPWFLLVYQVYVSGMLGDWLYALQMGNPQKLAYSTRFPLPIFYLIEMTWPYGTVHPISLFIYAFGLMGLGLFAWRRRPEDKFLLIWFLTVFIFFTLIPNKDWRYITPVFPVLAISAASFIFYTQQKLTKRLKLPQIKLKKRWSKGYVCFMIFLLITASYAFVDAVYMASRLHIDLPVRDATVYIAEKLEQNQSVAVICASNLLNQDMVQFYLRIIQKERQVLSYPSVPVDTYEVNFSVEELVMLCQKNNVGYIMLLESEPNIEFFNSTLTSGLVYDSMLSTGHFIFEATFGDSSNKIHIAHVL